jgi:hypothetical protein
MPIAIYFTILMLWIDKYIPIGNLAGLLAFDLWFIRMLYIGYIALIVGYSDAHISVESLAKRRKNAVILLRDFQSD